MHNVLVSDFKTVASEITALVFPKIQFQVLFREIDMGNIAITFKSHTHFYNNFRIQFYIKTRTLVISGYSLEKIVHLNYLKENNYNWRNESGSTITKPAGIGEKFEFLARKFSPILQEFYLGEVFEYPIYHEFETAATSVAERIFPQFNFRLNYKRNREKALCLNFLGNRNMDETVKIETEIFAQKESIFFNVDFRSHAKCLAIHTRWDGEQYLLVYQSSGDLHWSSLRSPDISHPLAFGQELETIAIKLYPLLQEFFPG